MAPKKQRRFNVDLAQDVESMLKQRCVPPGINSDTAENYK